MKTRYGQKAKPKNGSDDVIVFEDVMKGQKSIFAKMDDWLLNTLSKARKFKEVKKLRQDEIQKSSDMHENFNDKSKTIVTKSESTIESHSSSKPKNHDKHARDKKLHHDTVHKGNLLVYDGIIVCSKHEKRTNVKHFFIEQGRTNFIS